MPWPSPLFGRGNAVPDDEQCPARAPGLFHGSDGYGKCQDCGAALWWRSRQAALGLSTAANANPIEPTQAANAPAEEPDTDPLGKFTAKQRRTLLFLRVSRYRGKWPG